MSKLRKFFAKNNQGLIFKWDHYFDIFEQHFTRFKGKNIVLLEIGVYHGGSLRMWQNYFGKSSKIFGVDIDPRCKKFELGNIRIIIGDQADPGFLKNLKKEIPKVDILIDDGGHRMEQQINTFEMLFDHVKENGIYLVEDLHTSYWKKFGGGYCDPGSFIEYSKNFIDKLNAWHSQDEELQADSFTESTGSLHFYDSVLVIEKTRRKKPFTVKSGKPTLKLK
jgi:hypothetical protein